MKYWLWLGLTTWIWGIVSTTIPAQEMAASSLDKKNQTHITHQDIPLSSLLRNLQERHGVYFTYRKELITSLMVSSVILEEPDLSRALDLALAGTHLGFKRIGRLNVVLFKIKPARKQESVPEQKSLSNPLPNPSRQLSSGTSGNGKVPDSEQPENGQTNRFWVLGKVTNTKGEPLAGVNIVLKDNYRKGTHTDQKGQFQLALEEPEHVLLFSYMGYRPKEMPVAKTGRMQLQLEEDISELDEVMVIGYGSASRRNLTGAMSTVKNEELQLFEAGSFDQQLQGWASGVQVQTASGLPGAPVRVLIRGTNSLFSGTEPLWVIDGMILSEQGGGELRGFSRSVSAEPVNPLTMLNPDDIASIEILKDAAATAVYGSRGANGVILVRTKNGSNGNGRITLSSQYGISSIIRGPEEIGYVDGPTWLRLADEARANRGLSPFDPNSILNDSRDPGATLDRHAIADQNWPREILRKGSVYELSLSASKAADRLQYYWSGNYRKENSFLRRDNLERLALRTNLDYQPVKGLDMSTKLHFSSLRRERAPDGGEPGGNANLGNGGYYMANTGAIPILPAYRPGTGQERRLFDPMSGRNLAATFDRNQYINDIVHRRVLGIQQFTYQLPGLEGWSLHSDWGIDLVHTDQIEWGSAVIREHSSYAFDFSSAFLRWNYNFYLSLDRDFGDQQHHLSWVGGIESTRQRERFSNLEGQDLTGSGKELGTPKDILRISSGIGNEKNFRGYFSRLNYRYLDRYLLGVSVRKDASSIFAPDQRWGLFTAFSAGWILSEEPFLKQSDAIDFLKLKMSFGQTGNSSINPRAGETTYAGWGRYGDVGGGDLLNNIGNESITWETTDSWDAGVEFSLLDDRFSGSLGTYMQDIRDMLYRVPIPVSSGIFHNSPTIWQNIGNMRNWGWELELKSRNIQTEDWQWQTGFTLTFNHNRITKLVDRQNEIYSPGNNPLVTREGDQIGFFRLAKYAGIHPEGGYELIYEMDVPHYEATGERIPTGRTIPASRENMSTHLFDLSDKSGLPTFFGGWSNKVKYRQWEMNALISFSGGNYLYDYHERNTSYVNRPQQIRQSILDQYWTAARRDAAYPALSWNNRYAVYDPEGSITEEVRFDPRLTGHTHDKYLHRGDFMRLRTLSIHYHLPEQLLQKMGLHRVRFGLTGTNLLTLTGYPGFDPEYFTFNENRNLEQGWVGVQLPQVKQLLFDLHVTF